MDKINELLRRRVDSVYPTKKTLEKVLRSGKKIKVYLGIDPTAIRLHLGHTVPLRTLQSFADLGHEAILLFGTGTVLVGDPSERATGRKLITEKEIEKNIATWKNQVKPIINFKKVKIKYNGNWLTKLTLKDLINLGSKISAVQLFKRENFTRRIKAGDTVWYHETMYPLLQGYDSVVMNVDLEIGGTDQTFNMLVGRELQKKINNKEKFVLTTKMILGTDGKQMSKTSGNCIWLTDTPEDMYGKIMRVQDELIADYFEFFTATPFGKIEEIKKLLAGSKTNPMNYKKQLAWEITKQFHNREKANQAQEYFERISQKRQLPGEIQVVDLSNLSTEDQDFFTICKNIKIKDGAFKSNSEITRMIEQGGVRWNGQKITNPKLIIKKINNGDIWQWGKRVFRKMKIRK